MISLKIVEGLEFPRQAGFIPILKSPSGTIERISFDTPSLAENNSSNLYLFKSNEIKYNE